MLLILTLAGAAAGGLLARWSRLPGGMIVGAMLITSVLSLTVGEIVVPSTLRIAIFVGVGMTIGMLVTREMLTALRPSVVPALVSAVLLIVAGLGVAFVLRMLALAPSGDILATSPGALSVLSAAAAEHDVGAPTVALFHVTRIVLILLTLPLVLRLLPKPDVESQSPATTQTAASPGGENAWDANAHASSPRPLARAAGRLVLTALAATGGGLVAMRLGLSGALIFGTTLGATLVTLAWSEPLRVPRPLQASVQIGIGWMIGTLVTGETLVALGQAVVPAVLASLLLIAFGVGIAYLLRAAGQGFPGDVLATSPGALETMASMAVEHDAAPVQVALFHTVRLLLVILSLPLLLELLR